ncbi:MAG: rhodanese-like domain-containing protein [Candidatus Methanoperedens sp.]|nr:rhodanese-like domain-containing protein [Candidatus Methanoperedens sp.]
MNRSLLIVVLFFVVSVALSGCMGDKKPDKNTITGINESVKNTYTNVNVQQAKEMIDKGEVFILDVRTPGEYASGHIKNSTLLAVQAIPANELDLKLKELPKNGSIIVYCTTGIRSAAASKILVDSGFSKVYNMQGGITEWINAGYETVK